MLIKKRCLGVCCIVSTSPYRSVRILQCHILAGRAWWGAGRTLVSDARALLLRWYGLIIMHLLLGHLPAAGGAGVGEPAAARRLHPVLPVLSSTHCVLIILPMNIKNNSLFLWESLLLWVNILIFFNTVQKKSCAQKSQLTFSWVPRSLPCLCRRPACGPTPSARPWTSRPAHRAKTVVESGAARWQRRAPYCVTVCWCSHYCLIHHHYYYYADLSDSYVPLFVLLYRRLH